MAPAMKNSPINRFLLLLLALMAAVIYGLYWLKSKRRSELP